MLCSSFQICLSQYTSCDKVHPSHVQRLARPRPISPLRLRHPVYARQFKLQPHPKQQARYPARQLSAKLRPRASRHRNHPQTGLSALFSKIARRFANKRESRYAFRGRYAGARLSAASSSSTSASRYWAPGPAEMGTGWAGPSDGGY